MSDLAFTAPGVGDKLSGLDALRAMASTEVTRPPCVLHVPERPGWKLRFDANIPDERRQVWITSSTDADGNLNRLQLALIGLAEKNTAIIDPSGVDVTEDGIPLTFKSQQVMEMFGASTPLDAVRKCFAVDPHCEIAATKLYEKAGYFDEVTADPTPGSSTPS